MRGKKIDHTKKSRPEILPVTRSKKEAGQAYDRISRYYDFTEGIFEKKYVNTALDLLNIKRGETVLEIGPGTGNAIIRMAEAVGRKGSVYGIDISPGMIKTARQKIMRRKLSDRIKLTCGDALRLPYKNSWFDAVFLSFTLELFDTPEIPALLKEIKRVLKPGGRIGVVSLSKDAGDSLFIRLYEWAHLKFPKYLDCRPIYASRHIKDSGFDIRDKRRKKVFLAPIEMVVGIKK